MGTAFHDGAIVVQSATGLKAEDWPGKEVLLFLIDIKKKADHSSLPNIQ